MQAIIISFLMFVSLPAGMMKPTITDAHCEVSYSIPGSSTGLEVWNTTITCTITEGLRARLVYDTKQSARYPEKFNYFQIIISGGYK